MEGVSSTKIGFSLQRIACKDEVFFIFFLLFPFFSAGRSSPSGMVVHLGRHTRQVTESSGVNCDVKRLIPHEKYDDRIVVNDIALLEIDCVEDFFALLHKRFLFQPELTISKERQPICVPKKDMNLRVAGEHVVTTGWGMLLGEFLGFVKYRASQSVISAFVQDLH